MDGRGERGTVRESGPGDRVYRRSYDPDEEELSTVVVAAVSKIMDVPVRDIELNGVVHPEALNLLFSDRPNGTARAGGSLTFRLAGCEVTVEGNDEVVLRRTREIRHGDGEVDD